MSELKAELNIYYLRTDFQLDTDEFYVYAEAGEVDRVNLTGLTGLQGLYDKAIDNLKNYMYEKYRQQPKQLGLF